MNEVDFTKTFGSSPLPTFIARDGVILAANIRMTLFTGIKEVNLSGLPFMELVHPQDRSQVSQIFKNWHKKGNYSNQNEFRTVSQAGRFIHVRGCFGTVEYDSRSAILGQLIDITNYKQIGGNLWKNHRLKGIYSDISDRKQIELELRESQRSLSALLSNLPGMVYRCRNDETFTIEYVSEGCLDLTGYKSHELKKASYIYLIHPEDRERVLSEVRIAVRQFESFKCEYRIITKNRNEKWVWEQGRVVHLEQPQRTLLEGFITDITTDKRAKETLRESEARYRELADSLPGIVYETDYYGNITFANQTAFDCFGYTGDDFERGLNIMQLITPDESIRVKTDLSKILTGEKKGGSEYTCVRKDGSTFAALAHSNSIIKEGKPTGLRGFIIDITERKQAEEQLKYFSLHDSLTGLYNRAYFEQEMNRLESGRQHPVSIVVCDVDGLKLVNDTLGHKAGDSLLVASGNAIKKSFREEDMVARIGGDEFAVLLPMCGPEEAEAACHRIHSHISVYNIENPDLPLSISVGSATAEKPTSLTDLFKEADNNMYSEKIHSRQNARGAIMQTLMKALETRDFIIEGHTDRLQCMVERMAGLMGLPPQKVANLHLLAQFHDIGKVGIPDRVLFKPEALNSEERKEIQKHSEIGYRIALSTPDLAPIADWVLKHHEWWNGQGYPLGLKDQSIPLECRILAVVDAYDAMTNDRPYRKAMTKDEAIHELKRCAGTQFDPLIVNKFITLLQEIKE